MQNWLGFRSDCLVEELQPENKPPFLDSCMQFLTSFKKSLVHVFPKLRSKPYYHIYLLVSLILQTTEDEIFAIFFREIYHIFFTVMQNNDVEGFCTTA